jgi:UDP-N-acetylglucosamine 1-carboxyvinyltransferase
MLILKVLTFFCSYISHCWVIVHYGIIILLHANTLTQSGGCEIGPRPIDLHLKALRSLGAKISDTNGGYILCETDGLKGCDIYLDYPSVGATENAMIAAVYAQGDTVIRNAAKEPEIVDLQNFLQKLGAKVTGAGSGVIRIRGFEKKLFNVEYSVIPDRIIAGTYMVAAAITGGNVVVKNIIPEHIIPIASTLRDVGCQITIKRNDIQVISGTRLEAVEVIRTLPYPGFPTDMQAQMMALLSICRGTSIIIETIFESRYKHVDELLKMGANIRIDGRMAVIKGVNRLNGAQVAAKDLRGGAALVLAGLAANGETSVTGLEHIDRGYQKIEEKLSSLGANIIRV